MILRKHISFIITLLTLVSNSGMAFTLHYCGGKIAAVSSIFSKEEACQMPIIIEETCCAKPETTHKDCCSDKKVNLKSKADQVLIKTISLDFEPTYFFEINIQEFEEVQVPFRSNEIEALFFQSNSPPFYKLYCQYTFYC